MVYCRVFFRCVCSVSNEFRDLFKMVHAFQFIIDDGKLSQQHFFSPRYPRGCMNLRALPLGRSTGPKMQRLEHLSAHVIAAPYRGLTTTPAAAAGMGGQGLLGALDLSNEQRFIPQAHVHVASHCTVPTEKAAEFWELSQELVPHCREEPYQVTADPQPTPTQPPADTVRTPSLNWQWVAGLPALPARPPGLRGGGRRMRVRLARGVDPTIRV